MPAANPIMLFKQWFRAARRSKAIEDATAMCVSTTSSQGLPEGRMVLLKDATERGFTFYTNLNSAKGRSLRTNPRAALTFHWAPLHLQVRIQGKTEIVATQEADAYWRTRPRMSQLGAWASKQSEVLPSRSILIREVARLKKKFGTGPIPRPANWTGVRVLPQKIEFWKGQPNRLHDRWLYTKGPRRWQVQRLYP